MLHPTLQAGRLACGTAYAVVVRSRSLGTLPASSAVDSVVNSPQRQAEPVGSRVHPLTVYLRKQDWALPSRCRAFGYARSRGWPPAAGEHR